ncbi:MAG: YgeY family selenium metabolism-linked hydrolase [Candidatus Bipolaricaulis sp.]|nr:YgeY family selenium metabolism-linked hydrolase [Candidatus Bipolaricaulis sp.]
MVKRSSVLEGAASLRGDVARFASRLVQTKSLSGQEAAVIEVIRREMEQVGFDDVTTDALGSVIGRIGSGRTRIAMDAHIDTVDVGSPDAWTRPPFGGEIDGAWVYGRGAADQKGGMASMVYGMKLLKELDLVGDFTVYVVGSVMEEDCDGLCWRHLIEKHGLVPELAVITEPTNLRIHRGQRGRVEFRIRTTGVSAHASAPERGENAIYKMARVVSAVEALNARLLGDPFLGKGSIVISEIVSGSPSVNAVPDRCEVHIDRRTTVGETWDTVLAETRELLHDVGVDAEVLELNYDEPAYTGLRYPMKKVFPAWVIDETHPVIAAGVETYRQVFGGDPEVSRWDFSTNGTVISGVYGIPVVGFGPGDEALAHAPNERVSIDQLVRAAAFYAAFPRVACRRTVTREQGE